MAECTHCKKVLKHGQDLGPLSNSSMLGHPKIQLRTLLLGNEVGNEGANGFFIVKGREHQRTEVESPAQRSREEDGQIARGGRHQMPDPHHRRKFLTTMDEFREVQEKALCYLLHVTKRR